MSLTIVRRIEMLIKNIRGRNAASFMRTPASSIRQSQKSPSISPPSMDVGWIEDIGSKMSFSEIFNSIFIYWPFFGWKREWFRFKTDSIYSTSSFFFQFNWPPSACRAVKQSKAEEKPNFFQQHKFHWEKEKRFTHSMVVFIYLENTCAALNRTTATSDTCRLCMSMW